MDQEQPDSDDQLRIKRTSEADTEAVARRLARAASPGDVFLLSGPIGAGKSVFARAFIRQCLEPYESFPDVPSPTYTLVQTYNAGGTEIWHADLYRLETAQDVAELSLQEAFGSAICLVEWPDLLGFLKPSCATRIWIEYAAGSPDERHMRIFPGNSRMREALSATDAKTP